MSFQYCLSVLYCDVTLAKHSSLTNDLRSILAYYKVKYKHILNKHDWYNIVTIEYCPFLVRYFLILKYMIFLILNSF